MFERLLRVSGTVLVIAVGFVTPVFLASSTPATADTVVNGCTIVSNPTPTNFTNCPGANLVGADFSGVDLSFADLAGATFATCSGNPVGVPPPTCTATDFTNADLSQANLSGALLDAFYCACELGPTTAYAASDFTGSDLAGADLAHLSVGPVNFTGANLSLANLSGSTTAGNFTDANLTAANLTSTAFSYTQIQTGLTVYATLTGANLTGTTLVPSNQAVTATRQAGAVATWSTPPAVTGATPGSCTPASGSTFVLFVTTVTCQVLDNNGDVATGTFQANVQPTTRYFIRIETPSSGAVVAGATTYLDAAAADGPGVTKVVYKLRQGTLRRHVIATATPTYVGWLAEWDTTTVPNGTYNLTAVATDAAGDTDWSIPVSLTVSNPTPTTAVVMPSAGATLSGSEYLDASASAHVTSVSFEVSGGSLTDQVISDSALTLYGWIGSWNTASVPNGTYTLQSVACYAGGVCGTSVPTTITVSN